MISTNSFTIAFHKCMAPFTHTRRGVWASDIALIVSADDGLGTRVRRPCFLATSTPGCSNDPPTRSFTGPLPVPQRSCSTQQPSRTGRSNRSIGSTARPGFFPFHTGSTVGIVVSSIRTQDLHAAVSQAETIAIRHPDLRVPSYFFRPAPLPPVGLLDPCPRLPCQSCNPDGVSQSVSALSRTRKRLPCPPRL